MEDFFPLRYKPSMRAKAQRAREIAAFTSLKKTKNGLLELFNHAQNVDIRKLSTGFQAFLENTQE